MMPREARLRAWDYVTPQVRALLIAVGVAGLPGLAAAQDEATPQQDAPSSILETYRDWVVRCDQAEGQPRRCEMAQELRQGDGRLVFATLVQQRGDGAASLVFVAPFGVALSEGLRFQWEDGSVWEVPFATCYATGCLAELVPDTADLARLQAETSVGVGMQAYGGDAVDLSVSLAGFTAAWRRLGGLATDDPVP